MTVNTDVSKTRRDVNPVIEAMERAYGRALREVADPIDNPKIMQAALRAALETARADRETPLVTVMTLRSAAYGDDTTEGKQS